MRLRFSTKGLLYLTVAAALFFSVFIGPRVYVAKAWISYRNLPGATVVHPRFVDYDVKLLNDVDVADAEESQLLGPAVLARATGLLSEAKVPPEAYGGDLAEWLKPRLEIKQIDDGLFVVLSHRESWHAGRLNHGRNTMSWKVLVALLTAYQEEAIGRTESSLGTKDYPADKCRHPFLMFHYVDRRLIKL